MSKIKNRLTQAMLVLMQQRPLAKITINDICNEAMLARATFYHHFKDKYDLINWMFDTIFNETIMKIGNNSSWEQNVEHFLKGLQKNAIFFINAYKYDGQNSVEEHHYQKVFDVYQKVYEKSKGSVMTQEELYCLEIYCRGAVFITAQWIKNGMPQSTEWMTYMFRRSMTPDIQKHICQ